MDEIEALLGVRPVFGGRHPQWGTHNALLSLGPGIYLEVIARDPELPVPARGPLVDIPEGARSHLVTWVFRSDRIEASSAAARDAGIKLGDIVSGSRAAPDGSEIRWQLTDPYAMPFDGAVPFLINWGNTPHPSTVVSEGGRLAELVVEHPQPALVLNALSALRADVRVRQGRKIRICAKIETESGLVTLQ